ncbi:unnamed protein product [Symbiodinium sp. CCMP2592]|nr:unnamed protein product [Symbiodinium sp. CCMP2592]
MAGAASVRRALTRDVVEAQVAAIRRDRPLPPAYLVLRAAGEEGRDDYSVAYLLRCRENGFMAAVPGVGRVQEYVESLLSEEGDSLVLFYTDQVQAETVRGRRLGPGEVLLLDLPWSAVDQLVGPQALRGIADRAARVVTLSVADSPGRPCTGDALDAAARWVDRLDPDTAQEYYASAQEVEEELPEDIDGEELEADEAPAAAAPSPAPAPSLRPVPPVAAPPAAAASRRTGALFASAPALTDQEIQRLRALAGAAPARTGGVERTTRPVLADPLESDLHAEAAAGALPPPDVEDPALEDPGVAAELQQGSSLQLLLLAQMRQNAALIQRLSPSKAADGIQDVLSGGPSGGDSSSGIKGHLARDAFLRQLQDAKGVTARVQNNALAELGLAAAEPGLMRDYVEKRLPLQDHRTLLHVATMAAHGWEAGFRSGNQELMSFTSRLLVFAEQVSLDAGKLQLGYLLGGFPDPSPLGLASRRAPGLRTFSRLAAPQWLAANLAYLKDLDYAETRIAQLGTGRPPAAPKSQPSSSAGQDATEQEEEQQPRRRPPRRPKNAS